MFPDGQRIVSGSADNTVKIWDVNTGQELCTLSGHTNWVKTVAVFADGARVVSGSGSLFNREGDFTVKIGTLNLVRSVVRSLVIVVW